jgi:hypothetical protein
MSKTTLAADTINYAAGSIVTGSLASITWFTTVSEVVKLGAGLAAIGMFVITAYKFIKELRTKTQTQTQNQYEKSDR